MIQFIWEIKSLEFAYSLYISSMTKNNIINKYYYN